MRSLIGVRLIVVGRIAAGLALAGCGGASPQTDGSLPRIDGGGGGGDAGPPFDAGPRPDAGRPPATVSERARALAMELRGDTDFLIGMGNDLDGPPDYDPDQAGVFTLGVTMDLHYTYLTGYSDQGGWTTWNTDGAFITILADAAERHGVAPMATYYQLALEYEQGNDALRDADRMRVYWSAVRLLFQRLGEFGEPAVVHFEPDLFGYLQNRFRDMGTTPGAYAAEIRHVPECMSLPETAASFGPCVIAMRDALAPRVRLGLHASQWGAWYDATSPSADVEGSAREIASFLSAMGGDRMDLVVVETSDRDAGFWETYGGMAGMCSITDGPRGQVYWDATNATLPNFATHLRWVRALTEAAGLPALWWQTPFGVPSDTCGGTDEHYRDNRVSYFFAHPEELIAAGGLGVVFGTGAGRQTYITTDEGQFQRAVTQWFASPLPL